MVLAQGLVVVESPGLVSWMAILGANWRVHWAAWRQRAQRLFPLPAFIFQARRRSRTRRQSWSPDPRISGPGFPIPWWRLRSRRVSKRP